MRMDRYEDENQNNEQKTTRLDKNQELYTDVYLNNVYVDIDNLKDVMDDSEEEIKTVKTNYDYSLDYNYEEKEYDINKVIEKALQDKVDDKLKRHIDIEDSNKEIQELIKNITLNAAKEERDENLLEDLMPTNDNTTVIPPLEEPILDTSIYTKVLDEKEETSGNIFEDTTNEYDKIKSEDMETDDSFVDKKSNIKLKIILIFSFIFIIIGIIVALKILKVF